MNKILTTALLGLLALPAIAHAEISDSLPSGLGVRHVVTIAAPAERVYASLLRIGRWWNPEHTYSKKSQNLTLAPRPGGCFCERLANGGGAVLMTVARVEPNASLLMLGALGPLATSGVTGAMNLDIESVDAKTSKVIVTYNVGGYVQGGLATMAAPVDKMLGDQMVRLKLFVETGKPTLN